MPASRVLKMQYYLNEEIAELSVRARLALPGLWCLADRDGRLEDRPKKIKAQLFPYESADMEKLLSEMDGKVIHRYEVDGKCFIQILNWEKHAKVHPKEKSFQFPSPEINLNNFPSEKITLREHIYIKGNTKGNKEGTTNPDEGSPIPAPTRYGENELVLLSDDELQKLITKYGERYTKAAIAVLDAWINTKPGKLNWFARKYSGAFALLNPKNSWVWTEVQKLIDKKAQRNNYNGAVGQGRPVQPRLEALTEALANKVGVTNG